MNTPNLKPGDRVRLTARNRLYGYQPGDTGTVLRQVTADASGTRYYLVRPDKKGPAGTVAIFTSAEIETDSDAPMIPMNRKRLKVGDRVRLTAQNRMNGYGPGDQGVVEAGPITSVDSRKICYRVHMVQDATGL